MVVILGAGGHGREVADILKAAGSPPAGFVDDSPALQGKSVDGYPVLGNWQWLEQQSRDQVKVLPAVGTPRVIRLLAERARALGFRFASAIHPSAYLSELAQAAPGLIMFAHTSLHTQARLEECVCLNVGSSVSHDCRIGAHSIIQPGARLAGNVMIGSECNIGMGSQCIQGTSVGSRVILGAGAVVVRDLPSDVTAVGVPARVIKHHE